MDFYKQQKKDDSDFRYQRNLGKKENSLGLGKLEAPIVIDSLRPCPAIITVGARTRLAINDFVYKKKLS